MQTSPSENVSDAEVLEAEVVVEALGWTQRLPGLEGLVSTACAAVQAEQPDGFAPGVVVILFSDDAAIQRLNADFRDQDKPTNVLSFPSDPGDRAYLPPAETLPLGDVALALETCVMEAERDGKALNDHVSHLVVHAMLHIFGYDHVEDGEATHMEDLERRILARLGIADPYREEA